MRLSLLISKGTNNTVLFSENSTETPFYTHEREQPGLFERDRKTNKEAVSPLELKKRSISGGRWRSARASRGRRIGAWNMVPSRRLTPLSFYWDWNIRSDRSGGGDITMKDTGESKDHQLTVSRTTPGFTNLIYSVLMSNNWMTSYHTWTQS